MFVPLFPEARGAPMGPWHSHQSSVIKSIREGICANTETGAGPGPAAGLGAPQGGHKLPGRRPARQGLPSTQTELRASPVCVLQTLLPFTPEGCLEACWPVARQALGAGLALGLCSSKSGHGPSERVLSK